MSRIILFPTDYSKASNLALHHAVALARSQDTKLLVLHVRPPSPIPVPGHVLPDETPPEQDQRDLLNLLSGDGQQPVLHEMRTVVGEPAPEIVRIAQLENADLIVMANSGRSGLRRVLLGSVAEAVIRTAPCPVLTFRAGCDERDPSVELSNAAAESADISHERGAVPFPPHEHAHSTALDLLEMAISLRASDFHLDPVGDEWDVRLRIDGRLEPYCRLGHSVGHTLITQLKVLANLDIADPFHAQEGHFSFHDNLRTHEARVTTAPVVGGEALAIRLLDRDRLLLTVDRIGLTEQSLASIHEMLRRGEGVVLVTGPAGSGKTTTAFAMLQAIDCAHRNVVTIEDPPEFHLSSFRQMAVDVRHHLTMTSGLRTLLRMDPDIVLVGEVRDAETAEIAMRAASSGKYVFTTLHTRDVASTVTALRDLHIDNRSLGGNLTGIISQRLVRILCRECRRETAVGSDEAQLFDREGVERPERLFVPGGCSKCGGRGFFGRTGIFEIVLPDREICTCIEQGGPEDVLRDLIRARGTRSLLADGLAKVREGNTSLDEVRSITWASLAR
jgi:type II secretory ATPase GspE/PulE/Tfp pilus assembly ATPase PilB-like protein/nucleotide-binding universal stress UspA family protein